MKEKNKAFQIFRGICILSVVMTHVIDKSMTNPHYEMAMIIQNIINCAVTGFIFFAGYFVDIEKAKNSPYQFISSKLYRIVIPYLIWTFIYILFNILIYDKTYTIISLIKTLLLGSVTGTFYYFILYMLFILITPFIVRKMDHKIWNIFFYLLMPLCFIAIYYFQILHGISSPKWGLLPFSWFFYYYVGLKWRNMPIKIHSIGIIFFIILGFLIEQLETSLLFSITHNSSFSVTPVRFSAITYVLPIILLFLKNKDSRSFNNRFLINIGNNLFGIYIIHLLILFGVQIIANQLIDIDTSTSYLLVVLIIFIFTLVLSNLIIEIAKKILPPSFTKWIGFS